MVLPDPSFLAPGRFVNSDHPDVIAFARATCHGASTARERASRLFGAVRDRLRYDPYSVTVDPEDYLASTLLGRDRAYCVPKAVLLCAAARAAGIPARLGFADVKNHIASEKLLKKLGTDLFVWHGYVELWIEGRSLKATPAFDAALCARFGVAPLECDGVHDALLHPRDGEGSRYMEYLRDRGLYLDLPLPEILTTFASVYNPELIGHAHDPAFHGNG
jgi:transglutaminase-like putative cysteine protease